MVELAIKGPANFCKEEYTYILYRDSDDFELTNAIYNNYDEEIIFHNHISNMDAIFEYSKKYLEGQDLSADFRSQKCQLASGWNITEHHGDKVEFPEPLGLLKKALNRGRDSW